jgi:ElaB/YqjD/DUF883 family membrane-anchored ribosome-binding protein
MSDQPDEETRTESNGGDDEGSGPSLQRETRATGYVDTFSASNGDRADDTPEGVEQAEDVEIEVVLLSNDEDEGDLPRTLSDGGSSSFRWYMLAPGVVAAGVAAAFLLKFRGPEPTAKLRAGLSGAGAMTPSLPDLSGLGKGLGSVAGDQKARAQALAAQARARVGKTPPPKKSAWEETRDATEDIMRDNMATIVALAASVGLTIAARLIDVKRESTVPELPPPSKAWYQIGPWS